MKVLDHGHAYAVDSFDGERPQSLYFMKREGDGYPFNKGHYAGTNCQEVLRVLIDRVKYLNMQIPCAENSLILANLRSALALFEIRAADRHGEKLRPQPLEIEMVAACPKCGHIQCSHGMGEEVAKGIAKQYGMEGEVY